MPIPTDLVFPNPYADETEGVVRQRMLDNVDDSFNKAPGDFVYDMIAPAASEVARYYSQFTGWLAGAFPSTATGDELDIVASVWGLAREDGETDDIFRQRLLGKVESPTGSGSIGDWQQWIALYPDLTIPFVRVFPTADGPGTLTVVVAKEGTAGSKSPLDGGELSDLADWLDENYTPAGADLTLNSVTQTTIDVVSTVEALPGFVNGATQVAVQDATLAWIYGTPIGGELVYMELVQRIMDVPGVYDITTLTLEGGTDNVSLTELQAAVPGAYAATVVAHTP
jgi:uncharacterized phage protein gp47/JayE